MNLDYEYDPEEPPALAKLRSSSIALSVAWAKLDSAVCQAVVDQINAKELLEVREAILAELIETFERLDNGEISPFRRLTWSSYLSRLANMPVMPDSDQVLKEQIDRVAES